jgi:hypothetical protein
MLLGMAQVFANSHPKAAVLPCMHARQLEVHQGWPTILAHQDVRLLVQVVMAHATRVQRLHQLIQVLEVVQRQLRRAVQRRTRQVRAQQLMCSTLVRNGQLGHTGQTAQSLKRATLASQQSAGQDGARIQQPRPRHAPHQQTFRATHQLYATKHIVLERLDQLHSPCSMYQVWRRSCIVAMTNGVDCCE